MSHSTDLRKLLIECKELIDADAADALKLGQSSEWEYFRSLSGRIDAALAEKVEPVAWMHRSLTHPQYDGGIHPEKRDGWEHVPLYSSPVSGLRAGMLQAAFMVKDNYWDSLRKDQVVKAHIEGIVKAITKAADQAADTAPASQWRRVENWQPIETAPKTSHAILVYCAERKNSYTAYYGCAERKNSYTAYYGCAERKNSYTAYYGKVGGFLQADGWRHFGGGGDMTEIPTHWMPLPALPEDK